LEGVILPIGNGYKSNPNRASVIKECVSAIKSATNITQFSNLVYFLSILTSGSKLDIQSKDIQSIITDILKID